MTTPTPAHQAFTLNVVNYDGWNVILRTETDLEYLEFSTWEDAVWAAGVWKNFIYGSSKEKRCHK